MSVLVAPQMSFASCLHAHAVCNLARMKTATHDPIALVLGRLVGAKQIGTQQWKARCPAHDDRDPSLSLGVGAKGQALLTCHAGCSLEAICDALNISVAELFPHSVRKSKKTGTASAEYIYRDEKGEPLYRVLRFNANQKRAKYFVQERSDGRGGWIRGLGTARKVLYRLHELSNADHNREVFLVEGEKCVEALEGVGLLASTNPGGAAGWRDCYADTLAGRTVIFLPDNDEGGRQHEAAVVPSLQTQGVQLKVLRLPGLADGEDVADWLQRGGTRQELDQLIEEAPRVGGASASIPFQNLQQGEQEIQGIQGEHFDINVRERNRGVYEREIEQKRLTSLSLPALVGVAYTIQQDEWQSSVVSNEVSRSRIWTFTRILSGHPSLRGASPQEALRQVETILKAIVGDGATDPWAFLFERPAEELKVEFLTNWLTVFSIPGVPFLKSLVDRGIADPIEIETGYDHLPIYRRFLDLLYRLGTIRGSVPVRLCTDAIGKLLGVSYDSIARYLQLAAADDLIALTSKAVRKKGGKCAEYKIFAEAFKVVSSEDLEETVAVG